MLTILLDIDGVVADWCAHVLTHLQAHGAHGIQPHHLTDYDIRVNLPKHLHEPLSRLPYQQGFCRTIPGFPGHMQYIRALRELGRVVALTKTSPGPFWRAERHEWLSDRGFADADIAQVDTHEAKHDYPGDVLIEDRPDTLRKSKHRIKQLIVRPYSAMEHVPEAHRAASYASSLVHLQGVQ